MFAIVRAYDPVGEDVAFVCLMASWLSIHKMRSVWGSGRVGTAS